MTRERSSSSHSCAVDPVAAIEGRDSGSGGSLDSLPTQGRTLSELPDLAGFDFVSSEVNEALVRQLHRCEFLEDAHNAVLVSGPGTGKTHLATAIGVQAIEHHKKRVRFFSTVDLVNALEVEKHQGKSAQIARGSHIPIS